MSDLRRVDATRRTAPPAPLELWGGHECTVNRVRDRWFDQTVRTGHQTRLDDLDRFASLGLKALRYPVLWERIAPDRPDKRDWAWTDQRLHRLRELGMRPIAGLTHHGSGPGYTHLLDEGFAHGLAAHARAVAERYPWIDAYTPVNEPLTTARFAGQYGHWYPHGRSEHAFLHALMNEVEATVLTMREVRKVNPAAKLVQTEDLGHVFATDPLAHQAAFENERRWITFDLLCGRVGPNHAMWRFFEGNGLTERVRRLNAEPCPPDVIGLNYYLSSERFIDHRLPLYPPETHGGNGRDAYADVEAVRAVMPGVMGLERLLMAAHERFGLPLAVTEAHNGCTRDEQVRWLTEAWEACEAARGQGAQVQALTVWSLLGAVDWNSLLTRDEGSYEPGVFDIRGDGPPRETALADACRRLAAGVTARPDAAQGPGWWSRDIRLVHPPTWAGQHAPVTRAWSPPAAPRRPVLVTGADTPLGHAFARALQHRGHAYVLADICDAPRQEAAAVCDALDALRPWAVVDAAGLDTGVAGIDQAAAAAGAGADAYAVERLADACAARGLPLLTFFSGPLFDGAEASPRLEGAACAALGERQALGEAAVAAHGGLAVRTGPLFSPLDPTGLAPALVEALSRGARFAAAADRLVSPTYTPDLVDAALDLRIDGVEGVALLANAGALTPAQFARRLARALNLDPTLVDEEGAAPAHPAPAALASRYGALLPDLESAVARYAAAVGPTLNVRPAAAPPRRRARAAGAEG